MGLKRRPSTPRGGVSGGGEDGEGGEGGTDVGVVGVGGKVRDSRIINHCRCANHQSGRQSQDWTMEHAVDRWGGGGGGGR
jgi:hypothetical protein